ncbi:hypothetical protein HMPREF3213_01388 [Heyndrickxia coagulans]|uniref:Uncharacterized protein n=1 Tax=Heyndrickxia coagulans TaxID=1398 RepID=A0A133KTE7_HEYCO|nr:hypothetical protein HMPREF3213_01388 [Heyndrickxia coagulans]
MRFVKNPYPFLPVKTLSFYFTGNMPEKHDNTFFKFPLAIRILL